MNDFDRRYAAARRAVIAGDLRQLNPMQRRAAMTTEGPLLLLAGAGSGKTTVLIQRVYNLLTYGRGSDCDGAPAGATEEDLAFLEQFPAEPDALEFDRARRLCAVDVPKPWQIAAITFTNKAAGELKDRLALRLGPAAGDVWASTFHSACVRILRRDIERLGFGKDFTIYDTDDSKRVLKDVVKDLGLDSKAFDPKSLLSIISAAKDQYQGPEEFARRHDGDHDWRLSRAARVYRAYQAKLASANALDFDDIIYHTVTLLQREPEVLAYYQDKFHYVLVDEYQDTNHLQYLLTGLLAGGRENLCVVGDDDQSIYRFRGANIENILNFERQYANARVIRLEQNYRSTQHILDAANAVIRNNTGRKGKTLWTENGSGEPVAVRTVLSESDEAAFVVGDILAAVGRGGRFRDAAVLYRMNAQSNALEYAMRRDGVPYKVVGGMKFFDRAEVKDMLAYLCVVNNPLDDLRLRRIVNSPARGIGAATMDKVGALAAEQGASLYEILRNADLFPELKSAAGKLLKFADLIDGLRRAGGDLALPEFYDAVCEQTGYAQALRDKDDMESRGRLENVQELKSNILGFLDRQPEDATLSGFLNEVALYTDLDSLGEDGDCVTMMTIHAAKGLEFPRVYVVGMEEGIFPGSSAQFEEEELEEERRLCYVAMTRAKERLTLTNARQRMLYGRTSSNRPSRFLEEIPGEDILWEGRELEAGGSFGAYGSGAYGGGAFGGAASGGAPRTAGARPARPSYRETLRAEASRAAAAPSLVLAQGDRVEHGAFGRGVVRSVQPMGGDALVQVDFEGAGTKKLMLKAAAKHLKKVGG
nr:UvrD-helicase domain-containing protein [uncultured Oscillibacter sp.]